MKLYDTMAREMRELTAEDGENFRFYCCGPTVYGPAHIGNFRTFVLQDVFRRVLQLSGQSTQHVRNITDVDDKTIRDSRAAGKSLGEFTEAWTVKFRADCEALNLLAPHDEPSAVEHIPQQIALIEQLMAKGHAYQSDDGSVYFKVTSFDQYGCLSHLDQRELRDGAGGAAVADDEYEKDAVADFALWKGRKQEDGDNFWLSPWGEGRPGWHLECSAMCKEYLGDTFDLHSGGVDLVFPHHENEIAQSEAASGETFARHWFHITHLMVDGGKMSKSLGNMYTLADLEERGFTANELRYVLISGHYRHPLNFTLQSMDDAKKALLRIGKAGGALRERAGGDADEPDQQISRGHDFVYFKSAFESLLQDLNSPEALGRIFSELRELKADQLSAEDAQAALQDLEYILLALGLSLPEVEEEKQVEVPEDIRDLAEKRWQAKQAKEWAQSDALRDELLGKGWEIKDDKEGYQLCPRS
ncbi:MAG: cysteine--tRNA ligase [Verrucomicrobiota bacterium]